MGEFDKWTYYWDHPAHLVLNKEHLYEYYVTYLGEDRLWNRWVPVYFIRREKDELQREDALYKTKC